MSEFVTNNRKWFDFNKEKLIQIIEQKKLNQTIKISVLDLIYVILTPA